MRETIGADYTDGRPLNGGLHGISCGLPMGMTNTEISAAFLEIDASVRAIHEPPVAMLEPAFGGRSIEEPEDVFDDNHADYNGFWVNFEPEATEDHVIEATKIVTSAIRRYREQLENR